MIYPYLIIKKIIPKRQTRTKSNQRTNEILTKFTESEKKSHFAIALRKLVNMMRKGAAIESVTIKRAVNY